MKGLLNDEDLPVLFGGRTDLRLSDPTLNFEQVPSEIRDSVCHVDLGSVARNRVLLEKKALLADNVQWFARLYRAMADTHETYKQRQGQGRGGRIVWFDSPIHVLTEKDAIFPATEVYLRQVPEEVLELRKKFPEVDRLLDSYKLLHPSLESEVLTQFFKEHTHVQSIDYDKICRDVFLPRVGLFVRAPERQQILAYTRLLQKGPAVYDEIYVVTKAGNIKPSKQVFFAPEYSPSENWHKNSQYSPQIEFLSSDYLEGVPREQIPAWKEFFLRTGVRDRGENSHVEVFAVNFVKGRLGAELSNFVSLERQRYGYDLEARRKQGNVLVKIEVKGRKQEDAVELIGNEPDAAKQAKTNGQPFWVCIVPNIPENPELWVVEDAEQAGASDTLTISVNNWKTYGHRID